jgi:hypothetical protein
VYFESADQAAPQISAVRTDIAAFLGIAQMGPLNQPVAVNTWQQFQSAFGGFLPNAYLAYSAKAFFENGGQKLYVVRCAAPPAATKTTGPQPAGGWNSFVQSVTGFAKGAVVTASQELVAHTLGAQPADRASSLVDAVAGFVESAIVQAVQGPLQVWRTILSVDAAAKRLSWDQPLDPTFNLASPIEFRSRSQQDLLIATVTGLELDWASPIGPAFDLSQPIALETGANASRGTLYGADGNPTVRIDAASPGIWGDQVQVGVSHSSLAATSSSGAQPAGGPASFVDSVVGFPIRSLVRVYQTNTPPVIGYRTVVALDPAMNLLEWDAPLAPEFDVTQPLSFETVEFGLTVYLNGFAKEIFTGLSLEPAHPRYVETAITSAYIDATVVASAASLLERQPDPAAPQLTRGVLFLSGGRDGIAAMTAQGFIGDPASHIKTGVRSLEDVDEVAIVAAPDILIEPSPPVLRSPLPPPPVEPCCGPAAVPGLPPTAPAIVEAAPQFSLDAIFRVQQALVQHCEMMRFRFAILDSPAFGFPSLRIDVGEIQSWRQRFDTEFAALYLPWIYVLDPLQPGTSLVRRIPPSGHVAGVYANTDLTVGVHKAPANTELLWAQALTAEVGENLQGVFNPAGIDCIRTFPGRGMRVYGARTLSSDPAWRFVNVRRLVSMIEHALLISLQWSVFEPNDVHLWHKVNVATSSFLEAIWRQGGLAGNTAAEAFYVKCDATTNTLATTQAGEMIAEIGVAPTIPAEFVVFRIGRSEDLLEVTEL